MAPLKGKATSSEECVWKLVYSRNAQFSLHLGQIVAQMNYTRAQSLIVPN